MIEPISGVLNSMRFVYQEINLKLDEILSEPFPEPNEFQKKGTFTEGYIQAQIEFRKIVNKKRETE